MENKLTKEKLNLLIEQMLKEEKIDSFSIDYDDWKKDTDQIEKYVDNKTPEGSTAEESETIEKALFDKVSKLKPPEDEITEDDLESALAIDDNGSFVQDYETVVKPSLYILANRWNDGSDNKAKEKILKLYYSLRPQSQISPISTTVKDLLKAAGGKEAAEIGDQVISGAGINLKKYTAPKFNSPSLDSDAIDNVLQSNKQLGAVDKLPRIKIDESWAVSGASSIPLLYQEAVKSIGGNTVRERIENIASFFNDLSKGNVTLTSETDREKVTELFNKIIILQSVRYLASPVSMQGTTGQTGGWIFESLVASLAMGTKAGGNFQIEDVVTTSAGGSVTGYTLKFKKDGSDLSSALNNFLRFFFTEAELKNTDTPEIRDIAPKGVSVAPRSAFGKAAKKASDKQTATELYGQQPDKLVLIYGSRSDDYNKIQFKQMEIDLAKGREMLVGLYTKKGRKDITADYNINYSDNAGTIVKRILDDGVKNAAPLGPEINFSDMDQVEQQAVELMQALNVDIEKITSSFESFKVLAYTYLQNFKPEIAAASKEKFTDLRTEVNTVYETFGSGVQLENKKNKTKSLKDLDKLIERVILNKINKL